MIKFLHDKINRNFEDITQDVIVYQKNKVKEVLMGDPDLKSALGTLEPRPKNKFKDPQNPTEKELQLRSEIEEYNRKIQKPQIIDYIKIDDLQTDVLNYIMYDMVTSYPSDKDSNICYTYLDIFCVVNEADMETEYPMNRVDLLSSIISDLFNQSSFLGRRLWLYSNEPKILDSYYYAREMRFKECPFNSTRKITHGNYDEITVL